MRFESDEKTDHYIRFKNDFQEYKMIYIISKEAIYQRIL